MELGDSVAWHLVFFSLAKIDRDGERDNVWALHIKQSCQHCGHAECKYLIFSVITKNDLGMQMMLKLLES